MLLLTSTSQSLVLTSTSTDQLDYTVSYVDITTSAFTPNSSQGSIATATDTTIVSAPASSTQRQIKYISIYNAGAAATDITISKKVSSNKYNTLTVNLAVGSTLQYVDSSGYQVSSSGVGVTDGDKGDITVTSSGGVWTIDNSTVTYAKIQDVTATDKILGRSSAGAGVIEEITCTAAGRALIDDTDAAAQRATLGLGTLATQSGTFSGTSSGTNTGDQTITLTGDVTGSGSSSFAATIANGAVTLAKLANMATSSLFYRKTAGSGAPEVNSLATLKTDLGLTGTNSGDQTSLAGISDTKANFNSSCSDGDFVFVGDSIATPSSVTVASDDKILLNDTSASDATKYDTALHIADVGNKNTYFHAQRGTSDQSISPGSSVKCQLNNEVSDPGNNFDPTTNYRHQPTVAGKYEYFGGVWLVTAQDQVQVEVDIFKNGASYTASAVVSSGSSNDSFLPVHAIIDMNGSTDYVELYVYHNGTGSKSLKVGNITYLSGIRIGV